jgi:hypothetical protein
MAEQPIIARTAIDVVVAFEAADEVVSGAAEQLLCPLPGADHIVARAAICRANVSDWREHTFDKIVAEAAAHNGTDKAGKDMIVTRAAEEYVATARAQRIVAWTAVQTVIAGGTGRVHAGAAVEMVIARAAEQRVIIETTFSVSLPARPSITSSPLPPVITSA